MDPPIFACGICGKCFVNTDQVHVHIQTHTGQKPFRCVICWPLFYDISHSESPKPCVPSKLVSPSAVPFLRGTPTSQVADEEAPVRATASIPAYSVEACDVPFTSEPNLASQSTGIASADAADDSVLKTQTQYSKEKGNYYEHVRQSEPTLNICDRELSDKTNGPPDLVAENVTTVSNISENQSELEIQGDRREMRNDDLVEFNSIPVMTSSEEFLKKDDGPPKLVAENLIAVHNSSEDQSVEENQEDVVAEPVKVSLCEFQRKSVTSTVDQEVFMNVSQQETLADSQQKECADLLERDRVCTESIPVTPNKSMYTEANKAGMCPVNSMIDLAVGPGTVVLRKDLLAMVHENYVRWPNKEDAMETEQEKIDSDTLSLEDNILTQPHGQTIMAQSANGICENMVESGAPSAEVTGQSTVESGHPSAEVTRENIIESVATSAEAGVEHPVQSDTLFEIRFGKLADSRQDRHQGQFNGNQAVIGDAWNKTHERLHDSGESTDSTKPSASASGAVLESAGTSEREQSEHTHINRSKDSSGSRVPVTVKCQHSHKERRPSLHSMTVVNTENLSSVQFSFEELIAASDFSDSYLTKELTGNEFMKCFNREQNETDLSQKFLCSTTASLMPSSEEMLQGSKSIGGRRKKRTPKKLSCEKSLFPFLVERLSQGASTHNHCTDQQKKDKPDSVVPVHDQPLTCSTTHTKPDESEPRVGHQNADSGQQCNILTDTAIQTEIEKQTNSNKPCPITSAQDFQTQGSSQKLVWECTELKESTSAEDKISNTAKSPGTTQEVRPLLAVEREERVSELEEAMTANTVTTVDITQGGNESETLEREKRVSELEEAMTANTVTTVDITQGGNESKTANTVTTVDINQGGNESETLERDKRVSELEEAKTANTVTTVDITQGVNESERPLERDKRVSELEVARITNTAVAQRNKQVSKQERLKKRIREPDEASTRSTAKRPHTVQNVNEEERPLKRASELEFAGVINTGVNFQGVISFLRNRVQLKGSVDLKKVQCSNKKIIQTESQRTAEDQPDICVSSNSAAVTNVSTLKESHSTSEKMKQHSKSQSFATTLKESHSTSEKKKQHSKSRSVATVGKDEIVADTENMTVPDVIYSESQDISGTNHLNTVKKASDPSVNNTIKNSSTVPQPALPESNCKDMSVHLPKISDSVLKTLLAGNTVNVGELHQLHLSCAVRFDDVCLSSAQHANSHTSEGICEHEIHDQDVSGVEGSLSSTSEQSITSCMLPWQAHLSQNTAQPSVDHAGEQSGVNDNTDFSGLASALPSKAMDLVGSQTRKKREKLLGIKGVSVLTRKMNRTIKSRSQPTEQCAFKLEYREASAVDRSADNGDIEQIKKSVGTGRPENGLKGYSRCPKKRIVGSPQQCQGKSMKHVLKTSDKWQVKGSEMAAEKKMATLKTADKDHHIQSSPQQKERIVQQDSIDSVKNSPSAPTDTNGSTELGLNEKENSLDIIKDCNYSVQNKVSEVTNLLAVGEQIKETSIPMVIHELDGANSSTRERRFSEESIENVLLPAIIKPRRTRQETSRRFFWRSRLAKTCNNMIESRKEQSTAKLCFSVCREEHLTDSSSFKFVQEGKLNDNITESSAQQDSLQSLSETLTDCDNSQAQKQTVPSGEIQWPELGQEKSIDGSQTTETGLISSKELMATSPEIFTPSVAESVKQAARRRAARIQSLAGISKEGVKKNISENICDSITESHDSINCEIPKQNRKFCRRRRSNSLKVVGEKKKTVHVHFQGKQKVDTCSARKDPGKLDPSESVTSGSVNSVPAYRSCGDCGETFANYMKYIFHLASGCKKSLVCPVCGKSMLKRKSLMAHIRSHSRDLTRQCPICDKKLYCLRSFSNHMGIHAGDNPYKCSMCPKAFKHPPALTSHIRTHSSERLFQCDICNKSYQFAKNLDSHRMTHRVEHPYKCHVCSAAFFEEKEFNTHLEVHNGQRQFVCRFCSVHFRGKAELMQHQQQDHAQEIMTMDYRKAKAAAKKHMCPRCKKGFSTLFTLRRHMNTSCYMLEQKMQEPE